MPVFNPETRERLKAVGIDPDSPDIFKSGEEDLMNSSGAGAAYRTVVENAPGAILGSVAAPFGAAVGSLGGPVGTFAGGTGAMLGAAGLTTKAVDWLHKTIQPEEYQQWIAQREADRILHPTVSTVAGIGSMLAGGWKPNFEALSQLPKLLYKAPAAWLTSKALPIADKQLLANVVSAGALNTAIPAVQQRLQTGEWPTTSENLQNLGVGALMSKTSGWGRRLGLSESTYPRPQVEITGKDLIAAKEQGAFTGVDPSIQQALDIYANQIQQANQPMALQTEGVGPKIVRGKSTPSLEDTLALQQPKEGIQPELDLPQSTKGKVPDTGLDTLKYRYSEDTGTPEEQQQGRTITLAHRNLLQKLGLLRDVNIYSDGTIVRKDTGEPVKGLSFVKDRIAKFNPQIASADTTFHEIGHTFIPDMLTSEHAPTKNLAIELFQKIKDSPEFQAWKEKNPTLANKTPTEFLATDIGKAVAQKVFEGRDVLGTLLSGVRQKLGIASQEDLLNLTADKLLKDAPRYETNPKGYLNALPVAGTVNKQGQETTDQTTTKPDATGALYSEDGKPLDNAKQKFLDLQRQLDEAKPLYPIAQQTELPLEGNSAKFANMKQVAADSARFEELGKQFKQLSANPDDPEFAKVWQEREALKNKYGGMPPSEQKPQYSETENKPIEKELFYSKLAKALEEKLPKTNLPIEQFKKQVQGIATKIRRGEVELNESGLKELLDSIPEGSKVGKNVATDYLKQRLGQQEDITLHGTKAINDVGSSFENVIPGLANKHAIVLIDKGSDPYGDAYHYGEISSEAIAKLKKKYNTDDYYTAIQAASPQERQEIAKIRKSGTYAFIEAGTAKDTEGNNHYVITQLQSPRHQAGREHGYAYNKDERASYIKARDAVDSFRNKLQQKYGIEENGFFSEKPSDADNIEYDRLLREEADARSKLNAVPPAPYKDTKDWVRRGVKAAINNIIERNKSGAGISKLSWATGEREADYAGKLDEFQFWKTPDNVVHVRHPEEGGTLHFDNEKQLAAFISNEDFEYHLSPDAANQIAKRIYSKASTEKQMLPIGLEGSVQELIYDKILPQEVNKYFEEMGWKGKVHDSNLKGLSVEYSTFATRKEAEEYIKANFPDEQNNFQIKDRPNYGPNDRFGVVKTKPGEIVHSIDLPPEMLKSVEEHGQPSYSEQSPEEKAKIDLVHAAQLTPITGGQSLFDISNVGPYKLFSSIVQKVDRLGGPGHIAAEALETYFRKLREYRGQFLEQSIRPLRELAGVNVPKGITDDPFAAIAQYWRQDTPAMRRVVKYFDDVQKDGKSKIILTPEEDAIKNKVAEDLTRAREFQNANPNIKHKGGFWDEYLPQTPDWNKMKIMLGKPSSPEAKQLKLDFLKYQIEMAMKKAGMSSEASVAFARDSWNELMAGYAKQNVNLSSQFGPVDKPAGFGLPESLREKNLILRLSRYYERFGRRMAYADSLDPEFHPDVGSAANEIKATEEWKIAMRQVEGLVPHDEKIVKATLGAFRSGILGTWQGVQDIVSMPAFAAQYARDPISLAKNIAAGLRNFKENWDASFEKGVNRTNISALEMSEGIDMLHTITRIRDVLSAAQGRNLLEQTSRTVNFGLMKDMALDYLNEYKRTGKWSKQGKLFFEANGKGIPEWQTGELTPEQLKEVAAQGVENTQTMYDPRDLPSWALEGSMSPVFALSRWSLAKLNNFNQHIVNPAVRDGNYYPLIYSMLGAMVSGTLLKTIYQSVTGYKPKEADWKEIQAAYEQNKNLSASIMPVVYKLASIASMTGYTGFQGNIAKMALDKLYAKNTPQQIENLLISSVVNNVNMVADYVSSIKENDTEQNIRNISRLASDIAANNIQIYRNIYQHISTDAKIGANLANEQRDLKTFRLLTDTKDVEEPSGDVGNKYKKSLQTEFVNSPDMQQAYHEIFPKLVQQAYDRSKDATGNINPEKLESEITKALNSPVPNIFPSMDTEPLSWGQYINFLRKTQGQKEVSRRLQEWMTAEATGLRNPQVQMAAPH